MLSNLGPREIVAHKRAKVLATLTQRRQHKTNDVEAEEQIFSEAPGANGILERRVRRRNEADVGLALLRLADALVRLHRRVRRVRLCGPHHAPAWSGTNAARSR